jgi:TRAP-type transport system periplasmic protein
MAALETLKKHGMEVTEFTPEEIERMREKLRPVTEKYTREVGDALVQELHAEIRKVRDRQ